MGNAKLLFIPLMLAAIFAACPLDPFAASRERLVVMSYNCQNLFDDVDQGSEYPEYDPSGGEWDRDAYLAKLAAVAEAVRRAPTTPDLLLFQEIENRAVLAKLCDEFLPYSGYSFVAAPAGTGAAVQTAVASRRPVVDLRVHRPGGGDGERNILEVRLAVEGGELLFFNNHWKSRLGGEEETEPQRIRAALLLQRRLAEIAASEPDLPVVIAGDLNEDPFGEPPIFPTALARAGSRLPGEAVLELLPLDDPEGIDARFLRSGWREDEPGGSYFYAGRWQRIDHIFWNGVLEDGAGWEAVECGVLDDVLLLDDDIPRAFDGDNLSGFSDHLPLILILDRRD